MFNLEVGFSEKIFKSAKQSRKRTMNAMKKVPSGSGRASMKEVPYDEDLAFLDAVEGEETISSIEELESVDVECGEATKNKGKLIVKREFSEGSKALLNAIDECGETGITVPRKKTKPARRNQSESLYQALAKNDELFERMLDSLKEDAGNTSEKERTLDSTKYGDITNRVTTFLDSLPQNTRYRAIGDLHNALSSIEDKYSSANSVPQPVVPPAHYPPNYNLQMQPSFSMYNSYPNPFPQL